jgi:hypothetical protein
MTTKNDDLQQQDGAATPELPTSTPRRLKLLEYKPEYYGGINQDDPEAKVDAIIFLPDAGNIVQFTGDQAKNKSSNLNCIKALFGAEEVANATNSNAKKKAATLKFEYDDKTYEIRLINNNFTVKLIQKVGDKEVSSEVKSPKQFLKDLIGPVGVSPLALKTMDGASQLKWIRSITRMSETELQLEAELVANRKKAYDERTEINRDANRLYTEVKASGYYEWEADNKVFHETPTLKEHAALVANKSHDDGEIKKRLAAKQSEVDHYNSISLRLKNNEAYKPKMEQEVANLEKLLADKKAALENLNLAIETDISDGKQFENVATELQAIQDELGNVGKLQIMKNNIEANALKLKAYNAAATQSVLLTSKIDNYDALRQEMIKQFTPAIEGLEVIPAGLDPQRLEGIYYKGHAPAEWSTSEGYGFWLKAMQAQKLKVAILEDVNILGTDAVECINYFAKEGGVVFLSCTQRGVDSLTVEFLREIPVGKS